MTDVTMDMTKVVLDVMCPYCSTVSQLLWCKYVPGLPSNKMVPMWKGNCTNCGARITLATISEED